LPEGTKFRNGELAGVSCKALLDRNPPLAVVYECAYTGCVVQWDENKAAANQRKHGVDFADAASVLEDEAGLTMADDHPEEERWVTLGMDALGQILVVAYTWRDDEPRLISARKANRAERRQYESER